MIKYLGNFIILLLLISSSACEEKISGEELNKYKVLMDKRLGHLGQAIIMQGRLLDAYNLSNARADEDHFKEAEELIREFKPGSFPELLPDLLVIPNAVKDAFLNLGELEKN